MRKKRRRNRKIIIILSSVVTLTILSGVVFVKISQAGGATLNGTGTARASNELPDTYPDDSSDYTYIPPTPVDEASGEAPSPDPAETAEEPFVPATEMDLDPASLTVFVNKEYSLPKDYKPEHLVTPNVVFNLTTYDERTLMRPEAAEALEKLFNAAKEDGIILYGISGYRSYQRQTSIFTSNIVKKGKKYTLRYSAVPGTSEHQTGLAIDVSAKSLNFRLSTGFSSSPEGIWLADNAHYYGYIIRYPSGDEEITGYAYEPWHIRYVGTALANYLYTNQLTLEEYYHYTPDPDFDFEAVYAKFINYTPPAVTEIPVEEEEIIVDENGNIIDGTEDTPSETPEDKDGKDKGPGKKPEKPSDSEETPENEDDDITPEPEENEPPEQPSEDDTDDGTDSNEITGTPEATDPDSSEDGEGMSPTPPPASVLTVTPVPAGSSDSASVFAP